MCWMSVNSVLIAEGKCAIVEGERFCASEQIAFRESGGDLDASQSPRGHNYGDFMTASSWNRNRCLATIMRWSSRRTLFTETKIWLLSHRGRCHGTMPSACVSNCGEASSRARAISMYGMARSLHLRQCLVCSSSVHPPVSLDRATTERSPLASCSTPLNRTTQTADFCWVGLTSRRSKRPFLRLQLDLLDG